MTAPAVLKLSDLKTLAAKAKAKADPHALIEGARFVSKVDPTDARFVIVELRRPNPAIVDQPFDPADLSGADALRAYYEMAGGDIADAQAAAQSRKR